MTARFFIRSIFVWALYMAPALALRVHAQADPCNNPIQVQATIINGTCGNATGAIFLNVIGGNNGIAFNWNPAVSGSNNANNLFAGTYSVQLTRTSEPACVLDTTFIVNNSNGPQFQVAAVQPANCVAANGALSLTPANLTYDWNNGEQGAVNTGLTTGCYIVSATNGAGCTSISTVCVPDSNPLHTSATVLAQAKCNRPTGAVDIQVLGGSGNYAYSFSSAPHIKNLYPGNYLCYVLDSQYGCSDSVAFTVQNLNVSAQVNISTYNVKCSGGNDGSVVFDVEPGANFALPYSFALRNGNGQMASPGSLKTGLYDLLISDADSCSLPTYSFLISQPPPINVARSVVPKSCTQDGSINLNISGGNGGYYVDWEDLAGTNDTEDRQHVAPGIYRAIVYDSLFCSIHPDSFLVQDNCAIPDTLYRFVSTNSTTTICFELPPGVNPIQTPPQFSLQGGGSSGSSAYGTWTLTSNGCLIYTANNQAGYGVDVICINEVIGVEGLTNSFCVVMSITQGAVPLQQVNFTVQANSSATACGQIPTGFSNPEINLINNAGLAGISGNYGAYTINSNTGCINFNASALSGFNVDQICVSVYDPVSHQAIMICYAPSVLPKVECGGGFIAPESLTAYSVSCTDVTPVCIDVPYAEILNYTILDNGQNYNKGYIGCDYDTLTVYKVQLPQPNAAYQITDWTVNGHLYTGTFGTMEGLLALMNQIQPGWHFEDSITIVGGGNGLHCGNIFIKKVPGTQTIVSQPGMRLYASGSELRFLPGAHQVVFRNILTGCADTVAVTVLCVDCPPVHNYPLDVFGNIAWQLSDCVTDTAFCTTIPLGAIGDYTVKDNDQVFNAFTNCGNFVGLALDTGYHELVIRNNVLACEYEIRFFGDCPNVIGDDTFFVNLPLGTTQNVCLNTSNLAPPIISITNTCAGAGSGNVSWTFDTPNGCVILNGQAVGQDLLCVQICNSEGVCKRAKIFVNVLPSGSDKVLVYNGISPNGDGDNDVWHIPGIEQFPNNKVEVYNRWGNRVYSRKSYSNQEPWDGRWNDRDLPDGTYFYVIDLGEGSVQHGFVVIQR